jgi:hypothetical protein
MVAIAYSRLGNIPDQDEAAIGDAKNLLAAAGGDSVEKAFSGTNR